MTTPLFEIPDINSPPDPEEEGLYEEEDMSYNFRELMDMLIEKRDIIITVPTEQVPMLKKGLYARKSKDTYKLVRAGVKAGTDILSFNTYVSPANVEHTCVRVKLGARKSVTVINIEVPDNEL